MKKNKRIMCGTKLKHMPKQNTSYSKLLSRRREFYSSLCEHWGDTWWCRTSNGVYIKLCVREYSLEAMPYEMARASIEANIVQVDNRCARR